MRPHLETGAELLLPAGGDTVFTEDWQSGTTPPGTYRVEGLFLGEDANATVDAVPA